MPIVSGGGGGGAAFTGGTTLTPIVGRTTDPDATPFQAKPRTGATADRTDQYEWYNDTGHLLGWIDAAGGAVFLLQGFSGFSVSIDGGATLLQASPSAIYTDSAFLKADAANGLLSFYAHDGPRVIQVKSLAANASQIGFFGHAPASQPALTSGTTTPELIALALQAVGLASGT